MTPYEENESRRRRLATAEAACGLRHVRTIHHGRRTSTIIGRDDAEAERLRHDVHQLRATGKLGMRIA